MSHVLDGGPKTRILRFLCRKGGEWSGRRIAAELGLHPNTAHQALRDLRAETLLEFRRIGNTHIYALRDGHFLVREVLRPLFRRENALDRLAAFLQERLPPALRSSVVAAAVFGSTARGEGRPSSDIDLLAVVSSDPAKKRVQEALEGLWEAASREFGNSLAPYVVTARELRQKRSEGLPLVEEIMKHNALLWGQPVEKILHGSAA